MNRFEKEILNNKNLEAPSENVLDRAKSAMPEKSRKKLGSKQIFAIVSACIIVLIICSTIPAMIPANSEDDFVYNKDLTAYQMSQIDQSVLSGGDYLYFENFDTLYQYEYQDEIVLVEEFSTINGAKIAMLIHLDNHRIGYSYEKEEEYSQYLYATEMMHINEIDVYWKNVQGRIYASFNLNNNYYYLRIADAESSWQNLIEEFLF